MIDKSSGKYKRYDERLNDIILNNNEVDAIVIQFEGDIPNLSNVDRLPDYMKKIVFIFFRVYSQIVYIRALTTFAWGGKLTLALREMEC